MHSRAVLHINVVSFLVAVAAALDRRLRGRPVAVATVGVARRVLLDVSPEAHRAGVRRGMLLESARRACRDLHVLDPAPRLYERAQEALVGEACRLAPRVESAGLGHVFVDLTGTERLWGNPVDCSVRFHRQVKETFGFEPAVGVATSKLMSKVATRVVKPIGLCRVVEGCEEDFLAPLPVRILPGLDYNVLTHIEQFNIRTIKELSDMTEGQLCSVFGVLGKDLYRLARGIDETPVRTATQPLPLVRERVVMDGQTNDDHVVERKLFGLVAQAGARLRRMGVGTRRITLVVRYSDGISGRASRQLLVPLNGDLSLSQEFFSLLRLAHARRIRVNDMTIECLDLCSLYGEGYQLSLFDHESCPCAREDVLMRALDGVRKKFGDGAIVFGRSLSGD